ncbi:hypothetical protein [Arthrobacter sp. L77]|uniref:hypothetical protein n=1 Tax=Arthrobacter sp. L77 TaxID=1496689 RepID=UPI0005BAB234|nr:hypothetical protein [Arthrobacter sp. L77]
MTGTTRRRYRVRLRRAVAGSFLAAASAASLTGLGAAPALAVPPAVIAPAGSTDSTGSDAPDVLPDVESASVGFPSAAVVAATPQERLAGVRADLDRAVLLHLVTQEQATGFYAQIERRVAAGL